MKDEIVEQLIEKYYLRSEVGINKYGTTLQGNNTDDFITHALEEAMDFSLYLVKLKSILASKGYNRLEDIPEYNPPKGLYKPEVYIKAVELARYNVPEAKFVCSLLDEAQEIMDRKGPRYILSTPQALLTDVCNLLGVSTTDVLSEARMIPMPTIRAVYSFLVRELFNINRPSDIGVLINRDRLSVFGYLKKGLDNSDKINLYNKIKKELNIL